ncbi:hypothetical protein HDV63DRAFT_351334 [Trichoderma sp. SZMC 28014]
MSCTTSSLDACRERKGIILSTRASTRVPRKILLRKKNHATHSLVSKCGESKEAHMPGKEALFRPSPFNSRLAAFTFAEYELTNLTTKECLFGPFLFSGESCYTTAKCIAVLTKWPTAALFLSSTSVDDWLASCLPAWARCAASSWMARLACDTSVKGGNTERTRIDYEACWHRSEHLVFVLLQCYLSSATCPLGRHILITTLRPSSSRRGLQ